MSLVLLPPQQLAAVVEVPAEMRNKCEEKTQRAQSCCLLRTVLSTAAGKEMAAGGRSCRVVMR